MITSFSFSIESMVITLILQKIVLLNSVDIVANWALLAMLLLQIFQPIQREETLARNRWYATTTTSAPIKHEKSINAAPCILYYLPLNELTKGYRTLHGSRPSSSVSRSVDAAERKLIDNRPHAATVLVYAPAQPFVGFCERRRRRPAWHYQSDKTCFTNYAPEHIVTCAAAHIQP